MDFEKFLKNLMLKLDTRTLQELADKLGTSQSTISGWRSRKAIGTMIEKIIESGNESLLPSIIASTYTNHQNSPHVSGGSQEQEKNYPSNLTKEFQKIEKFAEMIDKQEWLKGKLEAIKKELKEEL